MSHFAVAVILKDVNDLKKTLAPYQENNMGDCPKEYLEFTSTREDCKQNYENSTVTMYRKIGTIDLYRRRDEMFRKEIPFEERDNEIYKGFDSQTNYYDKKFWIYDYEGYEKVEIPYNLIWKTFEEYLKEYCEDEWDEEAQDYGYWENPNAKWDYWTLCAKHEWARYKNENMPLGYCKIKDLNKTFDQKEYDKAIRYWEIVVEGQPLREGEEQPFNLYKKEYYIERYGTKEEYATIQATPHYWAFVLEGKWYEKGEMGWFAMSNATKSSEALYLEKWKEVINNPQYQEHYIAIVDCHI